MQITLTKDKKEFILSFDAYGDLDTVECQGVMLSTRNRYVQQILNNLEDIKARDFPVCGFSRVPLKRVVCVR